MSAFPRTRWLAAARRAVTAAAAADFGYGDPAGHPALRLALANYLGRARGVVASPERIMVVGGYAQGLALLCAMLREHGARRIALENPSLSVFHQVVRAAGLEPVGIGVDERGLRVGELWAAGEMGAVVVTPAHQFPLGHTLHPHRRAELVEYAHRTGTPIIEDDYDGEFRFDRQPVGALQALAPDRAVYAGTVSKTLAPGLRLAWLVLPDWLVGPVRAARWALGHHTGGVLDQLTMAEFLNSGGYDQHVRRCRSSYRRRRDRLLAALRERPDLPQPAGIAAGLHLLLPLPDTATEHRVLRAIAAESVAAEGLSRCWLPTDPTGDHPGGLIVGYAAPAEHAFAPAVRALLTALHTAMIDPAER